MSSPDTKSRAASRAIAGFARFAIAGLLAGALAGCFQPLYGDNSSVGGPNLAEKLREVEIVQIQGRIGNELRNDLIYELTGGSGNPKGAPFQMVISVDSSAQTAIVNTGSGLPENQIVRVNAKWRIYKSDDDKKKTVAQGEASGSASIDLSSQRYANYAAARDAEVRAGRLASEQIKHELIAYFIKSAGS